MNGAVQIVMQAVLVAGWTLYVLAVLLRRPTAETER
jgi:hypothetical protein